MLQEEEEDEELILWRSRDKKDIADNEDIFFSRVDCNNKTCVCPSFLALLQVGKK